MVISCTWVGHIAHQIRMRGVPPEFFWQDDVVPWLDVHQDLFGIPSHQHPQPCSPRLFRATASWCDLVDAGIIRQDADKALKPTDSKVIYVFRDLCDVCYSLFFYFPALFQVDSVLIHLEDFVWCVRLLLVERALWSLVHFWRHRHDPGILFLFFDELLSENSDSCAVQRIADFVSGPGFHLSADLLQLVTEQCQHSTMSNDDNWDRFSGMSVSVLISERLGVSYRYELEPYLGKVSRIGGKSGHGRRVFDASIRAVFDHKWRQIVTKELGFESLEEMQRVRHQEVMVELGLTRAAEQPVNNNNNGSSNNNNHASVNQTGASTAASVGGGGGKAKRK